MHSVSFFKQTSSWIHLLTWLVRNFKWLWTHGKDQRKQHKPHRRNTVKNFIS